jgi:hypothetical protein
MGQQEVACWLHHPSSSRRLVPNYTDFLDGAEDEFVGVGLDAHLRNFNRHCLPGGKQRRSSSFSSSNRALASAILFAAPVKSIPMPMSASLRLALRINVSATLPVIGVVPAKTLNNSVARLASPPKSRAAELCGFFCSSASAATRIDSSSSAISIAASTVSFNASRFSRPARQCSNTAKPIAKAMATTERKPWLTSTHGKSGGCGILPPTPALNESRLAARQPYPRDRLNQLLHPCPALGLVERLGGGGVGGFGAAEAFA